MVKTFGLFKGHDGEDVKETFVLTKFNELYFSGEISKESINQLLSTIFTLDETLTDVEINSDDMDLYETPILLWLSSNGGDVDESLRFINAVKFSDRPIYLISKSMIASAGVYMYMSVPLERRFTTPYSYFILHDFLVGNGAMVGSRDMIENAKQQYEILEKIFHDGMLSKLTLPQKVIGSGAYKDIYLTADMAVKYNVASAIVETPDNLYELIKWSKKEFLRKILKNTRVNHQKLLDNGK